MGTAYIVKIRDGVYKIGFSQAKDASKRVSDLQGASPFPLEIVRQWEVKHPRKLEYTLHSRFKHQRVRGEWFELSDGDLAAADEIVRTFDDNKYKREGQATPIQLYQRLDAAHGHNLIAVKRSRNGSPIADPHATAFYLRFRQDGKRHCVPAGADVIGADNQRKAMEARGTFVAASDEAPTRPRKVIRDEAEAYIERTRDGKKPRTYTAYRDSVNLFLASCKKTYLDELTRDDMLCYKTMLAGRYGGQTVFGQWNKTMTFLNDCGIEREVDRDDWIQKKDRPVNIARRNKNQKYPVYAEGEIAAMLAVADAREKALVYFLVGSGFRIGEAMHAQWHDIDWDAKTLTVRFKPEFKFAPKDYECRTVLLGDNVVEALRAYRGDAEDRALIFPAKRGGIERHLEDRVLCGVLERAKVRRPKKPAHAMRVLYACRLHQAGVDIESIRVDCGHSDIQTTQIYLRAVDTKSDKHRQRVNDAMTFAAGA
jgi:integrase